MFIEIRNKLVENNHLKTLFHTHPYILSYSKNVQQNPITSKHYLTLIPMFSTIQKGFTKIQSPPNTVSLSPKKLQAKPSQECEREKGGASLKNLMNGFLDEIV